jgi:hypothetical protein
MRGCLAIVCLCGLLSAGCGKQETTIPAWFQGKSKTTTPVSTASSTAAHRNSAQSQLEKYNWELRNRVNDLDKKVRVLESVLEDLDGERLSLVRKLKDHGVLSSTDLKDKPLARAYARTLHQVREEFESTTRKLTTYKITLEEATAVLNRAERQLKLAHAGIADEELAELSEEILTMNERMKTESRIPAADPLRLVVVLDEELSRLK